MTGDPIRIVSNIRNNRLMENKEILKMSSREFADFLGISYSTYIQLEGLKYYPSERTARKIADKLGEDVRVLFPEYMRYVSKTIAVNTVPEAEILAFADAPERLLISDGEKEQNQEIFNKERRQIIHQVLKEKLTDQQYEVLNRRAKGEFFHEIADDLGVSRERIRQIEANALRKLRYPSATRVLREIMG